jgi:hypothetical protein
MSRRLAPRVASGAPKRTVAVNERCRMMSASDCMKVRSP